MSSNVDYQRQGNVNAYADLVVGGVDDLATLSVIEGRIKRGKGVLAEYEVLTVTVEDAPNRVVRVEYGGVDGWLSNAALGTWYLQIWMSWPDGSGFTWPEAPFSPPQVVVQERYLAPAPPP